MIFSQVLGIIVQTRGLKRVDSVPSNSPLSGEATPKIC
jgi:hypothetical protein